MNSENQLEDKDFEINIHDIEFEEEEDTNRMPPMQYQQSPDVQALQEELSKTQKVLKELETQVNKNQTNWVEDLFKKHPDVDPSLKAFMYEMIREYDNISIAERSKLFQTLSSQKTELSKTQANTERLYKELKELENNQKFRLLTKKTLENSFKKQSITESAIDSAIDAHLKKLQKEPAYRLKVDDVLRHPSTTLKQKETLLGELVHQAFVEKVKKARKQGDPILKANKTVNEEAEKAKKAMEDGEKKTVAKADKPAPKLDPEQGRAKTLSTIQRLLNS